LRARGLAGDSFPQLIEGKPGSTPAEFRRCWDDPQFEALIRRIGRGKPVLLRHCFQAAEGTTCERTHRDDSRNFVRTGSAGRRIKPGRQRERASPAKARR
jgi:hypothetical protein